MGDTITLDIPENPTLAVKVGRRTLHLELGNMTYALECKAWVDHLQAMTGKTDERAAYDAMQEIAREGADIVSSAFVEPDAVDVLVGGRDRLNIVRIVAVIRFVLEHTTDQRSVEAMTSRIAEFADTGDED